VKKEEDVSINIYCLDPSEFINNSMFYFKGGLFFSATLSPLNYYTESILGRKDIQTEKISSPFDKNNLKILVNSNISLLYKDRNKTIKEVKSYILSFIKKHLGNYMVFVPSYEYLKMLKEEFKDSNLFIYQEKNMTEDLKKEFLSSFKENNDKTICGVCVMGGSFSEGIDLIGNRLIGVVIVGIGLPKNSFENELKKNYYDEKGLNGYSFVYYFVGLNKVMQAVGRLIRSEVDKGIVLLLDTRYKCKLFDDLFKNEWENNINLKNKDDLNNEIDCFYKD